MLRKLVPVVLSAFALVLLMGAGVETDQAAAVAPEEEAVSVPDGAAIETQMQADEAPVQRTVQAQAGINPLEMTPDTTSSALLIDGAAAPAEVFAGVKDGVPYVALANMAKAMDSSAQVSWDGSSATSSVSTGGLKLTAKVGQIYLEANGRYLYLPQGVQVEDGQVVVPLWAVAKAFDAQVSWDGEQAVVTRGSGAIQSGDTYYDQNDLFWLSRVIQRESGNQPMEGRMAVGNVVLNRVNSSLFPNSVEGVLAQKNQFTTYASGALAAAKPSAASTIAAKLVLDGGVVEKTKGSLWFDSCPNSWAARHKTYVAAIGGHKFYK